MTINLRKRKQIDYAGQAEQQNVKATTNQDNDPGDLDYIEVEENIVPHPKKRMRMKKSERAVEDSRFAADNPAVIEEELVNLKQEGVAKGKNAVKPKRAASSKNKSNYSIDFAKTRIGATSNLRPFEFLELPAELRNKVYASIVEDSKDDPPPRIIRNTTKTPSTAEREPTSKKISKAQKDLEIYRYRSFGLAQTSRQIRHEFNPLISRVQPRVVNIEHVAAFLNISPDGMDERTSGLIIDTCFSSTTGIDILPLIRLIDRSPDFLVGLFTAPPCAGSRNTPPAFFPGAAELIASYSEWNDIDFMLDLQAIRLVAPKGGKAKQIIVIEIPPFSNSVVKKSVKGGKSVVIHERAKHIMNLLCRSGLARISGVKVRSEVGNDEVTWHFNGSTNNPSCTMTVEPEKNNPNVLMKPAKGMFRVWVKASTDKDGWDFEIRGTARS